MPTAFETLVQAAIWAPSGDNTQPNRFHVDDEAGLLEVSVDPSRDTSPMNAGQRMVRIAVGAAIENAVWAAKHNGWEVRVSQKLDEDSLVIECRQLDGRAGEIPPVLLRRVTNRLLYDGRAVSPGEIAPLERATVPSTGVRAVWITDRGHLSRLAQEIGQGDALMFGMPAVRRAFLENVRFDRLPTDEVEEGLSLGSLEATWSERIGLRALRRIPDPVFRMLGMARTFRKKAIDLVQSASGLCILAATGNDPETDFAVGRQMQRAWLELTARNFAVQPMMSLPVLDNMATNWTVENLPPSFRERTKSLAEAFQSVLKMEGNERIAAILRFGYAPPPTSRTGRRHPSPRYSKN